MNLEEYFDMLQKMEQQNKLRDTLRKDGEEVTPPNSLDDTNRR